jgi:hypothetical protein
MIHESGALYTVLLSLKKRKDMSPNNGYQKKPMDEIIFVHPWHLNLELSPPQLPGGRRQFSESEKIEFGLLGRGCNLLKMSQFSVH